MGKKGNGEGTIYYSEKLNRWVGQVVVGRQKNGKLKRKSIYGKTRKEVADKINSINISAKNDEFVDSNNITLIDVIIENVNLKYKLNQIKTVTYNRNQQTIKIIEKTDIAYKPIQKISNKEINIALAGLTNYSNSVLTKVYLLIEEAYNYAMINKYIAKDPFMLKGAIIKPKSIKKDKEKIALTVDEEKNFLKALNDSNDKYKDIMYISIFSGMRIGEIMALKGEDIDLKNNVIKVQRTLTRGENDKFIIGDTTKTYSGKREVPIMNDLNDILKKYEHIKGYLFIDENHILAPAVINSHLKRICKNANIRQTDKNNSNKNNTEKTSDISSHILRHTFATRCIEAGMSAVVLQKILGHKNIETTLDTYTTVFNKYKQEELNKVNNFFTQLH